MYESRDAMPWYQSADLDFDAARAAWERQGDRYATWDWDTVESISALVREPAPCDVCGEPAAARCPHCGLLLCGPSEADSADHREYCESIQDGGVE